MHEDYRGDKVVEVQPEDFMVDLDYAATSLSVIFNQVAQNMQRLELTPAEANHRLTNKRYLAIYYKTSGDYLKLDPADWEFALDAATGKITITFPDLLTAYEVKIHCLFDDRDGDYLPVKKRGNTSEFANLARSMVRVYRVYERRYEDYVYDRNGNRMSETITTLYPRTYGYTYYPNSDRLKTRESSDGTTKWAFVYDNNGNLIEKGNTYTISGDTVTFVTSGEGVVYWRYQYDVFNRLVSVKKNGVVVSSYVYDPTGQRIVKQASETIVYDYDLAGNVIGEKNVSNGKTYSYVWVSGRHLARVDGKIGESGAAKYFYETDHLGSPMVVTDDTGNVVWRGDFTPFGEKVTGADAWVSIDTHGFTGKDWDEDVGLYYFNARWYDPELGRFISEDTIFDPNNRNLYVYCANMPINYADPSGHTMIDPAVIEKFTDWLNQQISAGWQWLSEQWERTMNAISGEGFGYKTTEEIGEEWTRQGKYGWVNWEEELKHNIFERLREYNLKDKTPEEKAVIAAQVAKEQTEKLQEKYRVIYNAAISWGPSGPMKRKLAPLMAIKFNKETGRFSELVEAFQEGFSKGIRIGLLTQALTPYRPNGRVVYRVLRPDEDPSVGLIAKTPSASYTPDAHVTRGSILKTQYISTTKDINVAKEWAAKTGGRIVAIDLSRLDGVKIIDLSTEAGRSAYLKFKMAKNFAAKSSEVLLEGYIPPEAITILK